MYVVLKVGNDEVQTDIPDDVVEDMLAGAYTQVKCRGRKPVLSPE